MVALVMLLMRPEFYFSYRATFCLVYQQGGFRLDWAARHLDIKAAFYRPSHVISYLQKGYVKTSQSRS